MEREPLLLPTQQNESPAAPSDNETESDTETDITSGFFAAARQVFSTKLLAIMIGFFMAGVCCSSIGALIGDIETFYGITDGPASFIFPAGTAGYFGGAWLLRRTLNNYGWKGVALFPPLCRFLSSTFLSAGLPFPLVLLAYLIQGVGLGLADSGFCAWNSGIPYANVAQGMIHGCFATGAILGPVFVTSVTRNGFEWYTFYRLVVILSCFEFAVFWMAFRRDHATSSDDSSIEDGVVDTKSTTQPSCSVAVCYCSVFLFVYIAVESSYTGWSVEYMKRIKHLDPAIASLSSSVFWVGMTVGRFALGPVTQRYGLRYCVLFYLSISLLCQWFIKFVPNAIVSLVFLGVNGFFLGPTYPSGIVLLAEKVPSYNKIGAVTAVAVLGQLGGALAPLLIGFLADHLDISRMHDTTFALASFLPLLWFFFRDLPYCDGRHTSGRCSASASVRAD